MQTISKDRLQRFDEAIQYEWLETNGLGGYSSSSVLGCHTRRYHGLLVAATRPPAERMVLVSKLDETIVADGQRFELGVNDYGDTIHPRGYHYLARFSKDIFPVFTYEVAGITIRKTIAMIHDENTVVVIYDVEQAGKEFTLDLLPLYANRGYHSLQHAGASQEKQAHIKVPGAAFIPKEDWFYNFHYRIEQERGLDFIEDLFSDGHYAITLKQGDSLGIVISTENAECKNAHQLLAAEKARRELLVEDKPVNELLRTLVQAADQFIVKRNVDGVDGATIIAGYHWFTDWGRDTMIALPGLCLSTGRYEDAKKILAAFSKHVSRGMLPNRFQDNGEPPEYNTVDGTLWYFIAIHKYLEASGDKEFVLRQLLPVLKQIIDWHFAGTRYNIHVDDDGLLFAGEKGQQLTWMDARIGDWVVTPRMGKPVEIQALWYNALMIFAYLLEANGQQHDAALVKLSAAKARESFLGKFWFAEGKYLYDVIDEQGEPDKSLRPNQLFAISLPFALVEGDRAQSVLKIVTEKLYTPVGLRSLSPDDPRYVCNYGGNAWQRDSCYHQGTVWSWLLGAYVDVLVKMPGGKEKAKQLMQQFAYHLSEGCLGSVAEIFDADAPHYPRGCAAQAWGVGEILRVISDYNL